MQNKAQNIRVLYSAEQIAARNTWFAQQIAAKKPEKLIVVAILKGSFVFAADLIREMHMQGLSPEVDFLHLSSYRESTTSSGRVEVIRNIEGEVRGRDVILVDDILESGRTTAFAKDLLIARGAKRVLTAVLIEKPVKRAIEFHADFVGFVAPDVFLVGYGMDVANMYRELPFVGFVEKESTGVLI